ncbi:hypothetical protein BB427_02005 [Pseudoalteromonas sp. BMB]|uniref:oligosaccharide flippase family protein n=1 Tax=Pseudoalteromonas sp. BMB TaxID=1874619 RepID=UPI00083E0418|nr:polysaccharide biosynthesis C-terminal domain-containing protein [Pseudoalteromonas sp. BMB]ODB36811.1 hypothetical protein BB427_02005 [Pseudoalteromonas sp. BMB]
MNFKKLLSNSLLSAGISFFAALLSFFTNILIAREFGVSEFATFSFIISLLAVSGVVANLGLNQYLLLNLPGKSSLRKTSLKIRTVNTFYVANFIVSLCVFTYVLLSKYSYLTVFLITASSLLSSLMIYRQAVLFAEEKVLFSQLIDRVFRGVLLFLLLLLGIFISDLVNIGGAELIGLSIFLSYLFSNAAYSSRFNKVKVVYPIRKRYLAKSELTSSLNLCIIVIFTTLMTNVDVLFLGAVGNEFDLASYSASQKITLLSSVFLMALTNIITPTLVKSRAENSFSSNLKLPVLIGFSASLVFFIIVFIFGELILNVFGSEYIDAKSALVILSLSQLINAFYGQSLTVMKIKKHIKRLAIYILTSLIFKFVFLLFFYNSYGINGVAFTSLISIFLWNFLCHRFILKKYRVDTSILGALR